MNLGLIALILSLHVFVVVPPVFVAVITNELFQPSVGFPEIFASSASNVSPFGRSPLSSQVISPVPAEAVNVAVYAVSIIPVLTLALILGLMSLIVIDRVVVALSVPLVTVKAGLYVPTVVGFPEILPVSVLSESPSGSSPADTDHFRVPLPLAFRTTL